MITTPEKLDALPEGSVVHDGREVLGLVDSGESLVWLDFYGNECHVNLPARVLYRPDLPQNRPENATGGAS